MEEFFAFFEGDGGDEESKVDQLMVHALARAIQAHVKKGTDQVKRATQGSKYFLKKHYDTLNPNEFTLVSPSEEGVPIDFRCPICKLLVFNPVSVCEDAHTLCNACAEQHVLKSPQGEKCPVCKQPLTPFQRNNTLRQRLEGYLRVVCNNPDCTAEGTLAALKTHHLDKCPCATVPCPNDGCHERGNAEWMRVHASTCKHRQTTCECGATFTPSDEAKHQDTCPLVEVACSNDGCSIVGIRAAMLDHRNLCLKQEVVCNLCGERYIRDAWLNHHKTNWLRHLEQQTRSTCRLLMRLEKFIRIDIFGTAMKMGLLEKENSDMYHVAAHFAWDNPHLRARVTFLGRGSLEGYRADMVVSSEITEVPFLHVEAFKSRQAATKGFLECHVTLI